MLAVDQDGCGELNYSEFLYGTLDVDTHLSDYNLRRLFAYLDPFQTGYLTKQSLTRSFTHHGKFYEEHEVAEMMREVGLDSEGKVYFEEFADVVRCKQNRSEKLDTPLFDD